MNKNLLENSVGHESNNEHVGSGTHLSKYIKDQKIIDIISPVQLSTSTRKLKMS